MAASAGPEKYREHRNAVLRKAALSQEGKGLYYEESGRYMVFWSIEAHKLEDKSEMFLFYLNQHKLIQLLGLN